jgi:hypothetical protein
VLATIAAHRNIPFLIVNLLFLFWGGILDADRARIGAQRQIGTVQNTSYAAELSKTSANRDIANSPSCCSIVADAA